MEIRYVRMAAEIYQTSYRSLYREERRSESSVYLRTCFVSHERS